MSDYSIVCADDVEDAYAGSDVPGEFHRLTPALHTEQLAVTLIRIPPHSDFEQGTGHFHDAIEELYIIAHGTLTFRCGDDIQALGPGRGVGATSRPSARGRSFGARRTRPARTETRATTSLSSGPFLRERIRTMRRS